MTFRRSDFAMGGTPLDLTASVAEAPVPVRAAADLSPPSAAARGASPSSYPPDWLLTLLAVLFIAAGVLVAWCVPGLLTAS